MNWSVVSRSLMAHGRTFSGTGISRILSLDFGLPMLTVPFTTFTMQELVISIWTPAAWSCYSGMAEKYSIDCTGVEDALDVTMAQRSELDYLIYNDPLSYADLILNGDPEEYLKNVTGSHGLED